jgi:hypothetical protein
MGVLLRVLAAKWTQIYKRLKKLAQKEPGKDHQG